MIKQSDRLSVQLLLKEIDRLEIKSKICKVWGDLEDEGQIPTPELCVEKLLELFPEKKRTPIYIKQIPYGSEFE